MAGYRLGAQMHVAFFQVKEKPAEVDLARLVACYRGVRVTILRDFSERCDCDLYCLVGVKHFRVMRELNLERKPFILWDKGYNRDWSEWWRFSYCSYQPWREVVSMDCSSVRAIEQGWTTLKPWSMANDGHILYAGGSQKYHTFCGLPTPEEYLRSLVQSIREVTDRPVVYRPRLNPVATPHVEGCIASTLTELAGELKGASVLLTHGSSACFDAMRAGVPSIVLGEGVTRGLSSTSIDEIEAPRLASREERLRLVSALAYFQWHRAEIREGLLWPIINSIMRKPTRADTRAASSGGLVI